MNILSFDTSQTPSTLAVFKQGVCAAQHSLEDRRAPARLLVPALKQAVQDAGLKMADIDLIVTCKGPGSFTGIRIGLAAAKGFKIALNTPLIALNKFDLFDQDHLIVLDALREDVYVRWQGKDENLTLDQVRSRLTENTKIVGNIAQDVAEKLSHPLYTQSSPGAIEMAEYVLNLSEEERQALIQTPASATYIRPPDISQPK